MSDHIIKPGRLWGVHTWTEENHHGSLENLAGSEVSMDRRRCLRSSFTIFGLYNFGSDTLGEHDDDDDGDDDHGDDDHGDDDDGENRTIRTKKDLFC